MHIRILAVGSRQPAWVEAGFSNYAERLGRHCPLELIEIPLSRHHTRNPDKARAQEGEAMLRRVPGDGRVIALDVAGEPWDSRQLSQRLDQWRRDGRDCYLLVGGPVGLAEQCLVRAECCWSLSALTLPHGLIRVVLAEALYRSMTILSGHPYHRGGP